MKFLNLIIVVLFVAILGFGAYVYYNRLPVTPQSDTKQPVSTVTIGNAVIEVSLARTSAEKARGLSGTVQLAENSGMLFEFNPKAKPNFWMKDMLIPLDIIWIADSKVTGVEKNVPPPELGTDDARLQLYYPLTPIDYVLEVNAGFSDKNNIKEGDAVTFNLP